MSVGFYFNKYKNNSFFKNFLTLFTGSIIARAIVFLTIPILTRLFSEEAFGVFALYTSIIFLLKTLATLCFELSIVLPKRDKDAINLFAFSLIIIAVFSLFLFIIIFSFKNELLVLLQIEKITFFIYFVPLSVFFLGVISVLDYWNNRSNLFRNISFGEVGKSVTMSTAQIMTGLSAYKSIGLVPGMVLGQFINMLIIFKLAFKSLQKNAHHLSLKRMLFLAYNYRDIPLYNTLLTFTNTLSNELPVLLFTRYFGLDIAGIYGLANKVSRVPPGIVGQSLSQVFFNKASKLFNNGGNLFELIKRTYKKLFITAFAIFIPLFILSYFLDIIFGENWISVGLYVRILIPWLFMAFLNSPVSSLISILNKQKTILVYDVLLLAFRFLALYIGYSIYDDIIISLFLFSGVGFFFNLLILIYFLKISKDSVNQKRNVYK